MVTGLKKFLLQTICLSLLKTFGHVVNKPRKEDFNTNWTGETTLSTSVYFAKKALNSSSLKSFSSTVKINCRKYVFLPNTRKQPRLRFENKMTKVDFMGDKIFSDFFPRDAGNKEKMWFSLTQAGQGLLKWESAMWCACMLDTVLLFNCSKVIAHCRG